MTAVRRVLVTMAALAAIVVAALVYVRVGWDRAERHCAGDAVVADHGARVTLSWEWRPPGFTCTFRDGASITSLWF